MTSLRVFLVATIAATAIGVGSIGHASCEAPRVRVACMGDSITFGARVNADTQSYPARLSEMLGEAYTVVNHGRGGATLIRKGRPNVWMDLPAVLKSEPNIVVIALGTNDTVGGDRRNWEHIDDFDRDYQELIDQLAELPTHPRILICTPTDMVLKTPELSEQRKADLRVRRPRLMDLADRIRGLAKRNADKRVELVELLPVLSDHPEWLTEGDGVHPNADGYQQIAATVVTAIRRAPAPANDTEDGHRSP